MAKNPAGLSVIIPTLGRPAVLQKCLEAVYASLAEYGKKDWEVIVVNNGEKLTGENHKVCARFKVSEVRVNRTLGSAGARNAGIAKASGKIIAIFDDDAFPLVDWFSNIVPLFGDEKVGAAGGLEIRRKKTSAFSAGVHAIWRKAFPEGKISKWGNVIPIPDSGNKTIQVDHLHGSNFAFSRKALEKVGGFDEVFVGHHRDETDFLYRIRKAGFRVLLNPATGANHGLASIGGNVPPEKKRQWAYWYNRNNALFFFKDVYDGNPLHAASFLLLEAAYTLFRTVAHANLYYVLKANAYVEGWILARQERKMLARKK
ncbi:MAG: glycosyltransferase [Candidatus Micrarchaeia archaeon]|jgi:GT2 family glycosyltransferase